MYFQVESLLYHVSTFQVDDLGWTAVSIISIALFFIYSLSSFSDPHPPRALKIRPPNYLAQARQRQAAKAALIALEQRRIRIRESWATDGFQFRKFPPELQLAVLAFCADSPGTYRALVLVSRHMYTSTLRACIPLIPITLSTSKQLSAFASLVHRDKDKDKDKGLGLAQPLPLDVGALVHHLWVSPLRREDTLQAYRILRTCTNVRVLACDARTLAASIAKCARFKHSVCRDLTLLLSRPQWESAMDTPSGLLFMRQLTHLRVMGEPTVPRVLPLAKLTHLSYLDRPPPTHLNYNGEDEEDGDGDGDGVARPWALGNRTVFPSLQQVVLTRRRRCGPLKPASRKVDARLVVLYVCREQTEMEMWCDVARGQSLWYQAANALPVPPKKKPGSPPSTDP